MRARVSLDAWLERGERRQLLALGVLAAAASAAKTTVLPVVLPAIALAALLAAWRRRGTELRRFVTALVVSALAGAPITLWQNAAPESYSAMAGLGFAKAFASSGFAGALARTFGPGSVNGLAAAPAFVAWLVGYLGLAGVAASLWLACHGRNLTGIQSWALGVFATGLAASLVLDVPGLSQLFLLYNGQLLLGLFAGAALAALWRKPRGAREGAMLAALMLAALPTLDLLAWAVPAAFRQDASAAAYAAPALECDYAAGLAWLRSNAAENAVVWADNPSLLLSAMGEVRLYYENGLYSARAWRVGPGASRGPSGWRSRSASCDGRTRAPSRRPAARWARGPACWWWPTRCSRGSRRASYAPRSEQSHGDACFPRTCSSCAS